MEKINSLLLKQELRILHDEFSTETEKLLGDKLWEIAADGTNHTKEEICDWLKKKSPDSRWEIKEFEVKKLADDVALSTYWAKMTAPKISESKGALHCSLWMQNNEGTWQMVFHQATKIS
jgi:hypothetical protein